MKKETSSKPTGGKNSETRDTSSEYRRQHGPPSKVDLDWERRNAIGPREWLEKHGTAKHREIIKKWELLAKEKPRPRGQRPEPARPEPTHLTDAEKDILKPALERMQEQENDEVPF